MDNKTFMQSSRVNIFIGAYMFINMYLFLRCEIPTKNTVLAVKRVVAKTWKGCDEKDVKSKGGG